MNHQGNLEVLMHLYCYRDPYKHSTCHCEFEYPPTSPRALVLVV